MAASTQAKDRFKNASQGLVSALGQKTLDTVGSRLDGLTGKLEDVAGGGPIGKAVAKGAEAKAEGGSPVGGALKGAVSGVKDTVTGKGGGKGGGGKATKATTILEEIDVGVPLQVAYDQWTEFGSFPSFMKKVENVEAEEDTKLRWKAQIFWSHREWEATILEQVPEERIVWRSKGQKGHVDGSVTFHELGPNLTRIIVVLEYYPQGFMERTGNLWRAQGRRVRAELLHFRRHVMTRTILDPDQVEGWRGTIEDGEVVETHEDALASEEDRDEEDSDEEDSGEESAEPEDEADEYDEAQEGEEPEAEYDEEGTEAEADEEPEAEYDEEPDAEDEADEDAEAEEADEDYEEPEDEAEDLDEEPDEEPEDAEEQPDDEPPARSSRTRSRRTGR
ncbi:SRPBCC family protein [Nocardioides sp. DS6]|uniref:SRPBCC family protein n=1 Tax=Nocardioides eburneus TaxID=3231482 RepID=A0ABV3T3L8_9ACTN